MIPLATYCERGGPGIWAEPLNAFSNGAFLVAALLIALRLKSRRDGWRHEWDLWLLVALAATVGIGSFLWHTVRSPWSQWADIVPILLFINAFLASFLVRVAGLGTWTVITGVVLFNIFNIGLQALLPAGLLNGSVLYVPTWIVLALIWMFVRKRRPGAAPMMLTALLAFTASLTFRSVDKLVCGGFPYGTHFAWHLCNGVVLYAVMAALLPPARLQRL